MCHKQTNKWIRQLLFLGSNELRSRTLCFAWILWDLGLSTHTTKCHSILRSGIFSQILALVCCWPHTQWRQTDSQLVRCEGREWEWGQEKCEWGDQGTIASIARDVAGARAGPSQGMVRVTGARAGEAEARRRGGDCQLLSRTHQHGRPPPTLETVSASQQWSHSEN